MDGEAKNERIVGVGPLLRACRLKSGATLGAVAVDLCLREAYLEAIEEGRFGDLPGTTYVTGFIRGYADYLGLDGEEVVRRFKAEAAGLGDAAELHFPSPMAENGTPRGGIVLVGILITVLAYGTWYVSTSTNGLLADLVQPLPDRLAGLLAGNPGTGTHADSADRVEGGGASAPPDGGLGVRPQRGGTVWASDEPTRLADAGTRTSPPATPAGEEQVPAAAVAIGERESGANGRTTGTGVGGEATALTGSAAGEREGADAAAPVQAATRTSAQPQSATAFAAEPLGASTLAQREAAGEDALVAALTVDRERESSAVTSSRITLQATDLTWVQVRDEFGNRIMSRLLERGEIFRVPEQAGLRLTVGNAGGLEVVVDGRRVPPLGGHGEVRRGVVLDADLLGSGTVVFD